MIRDNGGWDMFKVVEEEKFPCKDMRETERRENAIMKELKSIMNTYKSYITEEEKKRDIINSKQYYEENKTKTEKYMKEYSIKHKDEIKEYKKERYETNQEKVKLNMNENYNNNKQNIKEKMLCECGCKVAKQYLIRHQATKNILR
jgi:hypothetical protein